jgi:predicted metal-binding membrane protein
MTNLPRPILVGIAAAWIAAIAAQAAGAAALLHHDALLVGGGPPLAVAAILALLAWQVMIAAMMLPSSLPLIRLYARASERAPQRGRSMAAFIGGYALVWSAFGLAAFGADAALHAVVNASPWLEQHDWWIGGAVLALAGAFQFTSLKDACLDKCRHPGQFLMRYYERGPGGGFRLGARHGAFCVGCCWALMLVMFAAGVASLIWMALLTAVMIHEKTRPLGARALPVSGAALLGAASVVLLYSAYASSPV